MKKSIVLLATLVTLNTQALELLNYKNTSTGTTTYTRETLESVWSSQTPACIKDGAKIIGVNKAFKSMNLGFRDCSQSPNRQKIHKALGFKLAYFRLSELPMDMIKKIKEME